MMITVEYQNECNDSLLEEAIPNIKEWFLEMAAKVCDFFYNTHLIKRQIKLIYSDFEGVAHCSGDATQKTIHLSKSYLQKYYDKINMDKLRFEIQGVLCHELVHAFQNNHGDSLPHGLVEGIADYVRLKMNYAPIHWCNSPAGKNWDEGYSTTAYFLDYIESLHPSFVLTLNKTVEKEDYKEAIFLKQTGNSVTELWQKYINSINKN